METEPCAEWGAWILSRQDSQVQWSQRPSEKNKQLKLVRVMGTPYTVALDLREWRPIWPPISTYWWAFSSVLQTWTACCKQSSSLTKKRKKNYFSSSAGFKVKISPLALHTHKTWIDSNLWFNISFLYIWQRAIYTHIQAYFTVFIWFSDSFSTSTTKCPCKITEIV